MLLVPGMLARKVPGLSADHAHVVDSATYGWIPVRAGQQGTTAGALLERGGRRAGSPLGPPPSPPPLTQPYHPDPEYRYGLSAVWRPVLSLLTQVQLGASVGEAACASVCTAVIRVMCQAQ